MVGEELPLVKKTDAGFDGLSFVFIEAIRDQLSHTDGKEIAIQTIPVKTLREAQSLLEQGKADLACGVDFSWERQTRVDYTLPFATTGIRLLAPKGNDGTPNSLKGKTIGVVQDSVAASVLVALHALLDFSLQLPAVAVLYACIMGVACAQSYSSVHS